MRRLILLMLLLMLGVNGLLAWQNWKSETRQGSTCSRVACSFQLKAIDSGAFMLPGAWVYVR